jgi:predicted HNH restriction endonuclease
MARKNTEARRKYSIWAVSETRRKLKLRAIEYKGGGCEVCGYNKCPAALQFHHRDPAEKDFRVGGQVRAWSKIQVELNKTTMLCSNCHSEIHYEEDQRNLLLQESEVRALVPARKGIQSARMWTKTSIPM